MTTSNVRGRVYLRQADGGIGGGVAGTRLTFVREGSGQIYEAATDAQGSYALVLPQARYYVRATHVDYEDYASVPGFVKATPPLQICNFFLRAPQITTALVVRHADRDGEADELSEAGTTRAKELRDILFRSGLTEIYASGALRAQATAAPLSEALRLATQTYGASGEVAQRVLTVHAGDLSLVVAHSNTATEVIASLGGTRLPANLAGFDNLFVVSRHGAQVHVLRLAYGDSSAAAPELAYPPQAMTLLLVGTGQGAGDAPERLRHAASRANVSAIYTSGTHTAMVAPLAAALGKEPVSYDPAELLRLAENLVTDHAHETAVVSGTHQDLRELIRLLRGRGPVLGSTDTAHLLVLTRFASGEVRVVPLRL